MLRNVTITPDWCDTPNPMVVDTCWCVEGDADAIDEDGEIAGRVTVRAQFSGAGRLLDHEIVGDRAVLSAGVCDDLVADWIRALRGHLTLRIEKDGE